jgi:hypothetical protein
MQKRGDFPKESVMVRKAIRKIILLLFLVSIPLLGCGGGGNGGGGGGGTISLAWDANTESDLAGYKIYYGTASRSYGASVNVGNVTSYELAGLTPGQVYYISVTAYDTANYESGYSNEVSGPAK